MIKKGLSVFLFLFFCFLATENRIVTLVNPVRSRNLWIDKSLKPIEDQYKIIEKNNLEGTWLVQYDVLKDEELKKRIKNFDKNQEIGLFLEISPLLAKEARVVYPVNVVWSNPKVVFLSGYSRKDRIKMIDQMMTEFKKVFGNYPKSVGAWWIDSYSIKYIKDKYKVEAIMICSDQKTTDSYGIWGQWWSIPYFPNKTNILEPAKTNDDRLGAIVIQWAARDPIRAYLGEGVEFSNNSVQANDYLWLGKNIGYFKNLANIYLLNEKNKINQLTVGLETGQESVNFIKEYERQIDYLKTIEKIEFFKMSDFAKKYNEVYQDQNYEIYVGEKKSEWVMNKNERKNDFLGEKTEYKGGVFEDYFISDKNDFLQRRVDKISNNTNNKKSHWWIGIILLGTIIIWKNNKKTKSVIDYLIWILLSCGLLLKSGNEFGYEVIYGFRINNINLFQIFGVIIASLIFFGWIKLTKNKGNTWYSFAIWPILRLIRFSIFEGRYLIGLLADNFRFIGISVNKTSINFINGDFEGWRAKAMLGFNQEKLWQLGLWGWIMIIFGQVFFSWLIWLIIEKLPKKIGIIFQVLLTILVAIEIWTIFGSEPWMVNKIR